jgi:hypothetical protein
MTKKFTRQFDKNITQKTGFKIHSYEVGGKHYICKIICEGCEMHEEPIIFPNGKGTSISTSPSASNAWNSIKTQIKKIHREHIENHKY